MKNSKVKTVDFIKSFEYNNETYYSHRYTMEDGTEINANHKKMNPIAVGSEVEYEVKGNDKFGNPKGTVKELKQNNFKGGYKSEPKDQGIITYLSCLSSACVRFQQSTASDETILAFALKGFNEAMKHSTLKKDA